MLDTTEQGVLDLISLDSIVADTKELISARSENPGNQEAKTVAVLHAMCERIGAKVSLQEVQPHRYNLHATVGPANAQAILFLGHSDVVPAGEGWTQDPFVPRVESGTIIGRGATDMKGGLAAVVAAMGAVSTHHPDIRLELLCTVDEEDQALGVISALEHLEGRSLLACIVAEPTNLDIVIGCRGSTNLEIDIVGKSAHAGRPEDGASSIYVASLIVEMVRRAHEQARAAEGDPLLGWPSWNVGTISGGTGTSMVPQKTSLTLDRRMMPGEKPAEILADLLGAVEREMAQSDIANADLITVSGKIALDMPAFKTTTDSSVPAVAADVLASLGQQSALTGWTAACEGGFVAQATHAPTIILGPGDITKQAHQPDESVRIDHLLLAAQAYALMALRLNKAPTQRHP